MAKKNWIADATAHAHGQFAKKAQAAGMSTVTFARKKMGAPGVTGKQAQLAATLMKLGKKKNAMPKKPMTLAKFTPPGFDDEED